MERQPQTGTWALTVVLACLGGGGAWAFQQWMALQERNLTWLQRTEERWWRVVEERRQLAERAERETSRERSEQQLAAVEASLIQTQQERASMYVEWAAFIAGARPGLQPQLLKMAPPEVVQMFNALQSSSSSDPSP